MRYEMRREDSADNQDYASDPSGKWKSKDTAIYLLTSIASRGSTQQVRPVSRVLTDNAAWCHLHKPPGRCSGLLWSKCLRRSIGSTRVRAPYPFGRCDQIPLHFPKPGRRPARRYSVGPCSFYSSQKTNWSPSFLSWFNISTLPTMSFTLTLLLRLNESSLSRLSDKPCEPACSSTRVPDADKQVHPGRCAPVRREHPDGFVHQH